MIIFDGKHPVFNVETDDNKMITKVTGIIESKFVPLGLIDSKMKVSGSRVRKWWKNRNSYGDFFVSDSDCCYLSDTEKWDELKKARKNMFTAADNRIPELFKLFMESAEYDPEIYDFTPFSLMIDLYKDAGLMTDYRKAAEACRLYNYDVTEYLSAVVSVYRILDKNPDFYHLGLIRDNETGVISGLVPYWEPDKSFDENEFDLRIYGVPEKILTMDFDRDIMPVLMDYEIDPGVMDRFNGLKAYAAKVKEDIDRPAMNENEKIRQIMKNMGMSPTERNLSKVKKMLNDIGGTSVSAAINLQRNKMIANRDMELL